MGCFLLIGDLGEGFEEGILPLVKAEEAGIKEKAAFQFFFRLSKGKTCFSFFCLRNKKEMGIHQSVLSKSPTRRFKQF